MNSRDVCMLRTRLRQVNVEYSALVRAGAEKGRFVRMSELKAERRALMDLMAEGAAGARRPPVSRQQPPAALQQSAD